MNITRHGNTFVIARADGRTRSVSYRTTDSAEIRAYADELRERAARLLQQVKDAEAVATYLGSEAVKQAERDAEKREQSAEQAKRTRERNADPWGFAAIRRDSKLWEAFDTITDHVERRDRVNAYLHTCDELTQLCKAHKVSATMQACLIPPCSDVSPRTFNALRQRRLIDELGMPTDLGRRIGALAQDRLTARSVMRQDMLTEVP